MKKDYIYLRELKIKLLKSKYQNRIKEQLRYPKQVCAIFRDLKDRAQETMLGIYLNADLTEGRHIVLNTGTESTLVIAINEVLDLAIANKLPNIILIHNHPSGDSKPSKSEKEFIEAIEKAATATLRKLIDFIIVGAEDSYWSYFEEKHGKRYR